MHSEFYGLCTNNFPFSLNENIINTAQLNTNIIWFNLVLFFLPSGTGASQFGIIGVVLPSPVGKILF